MKVNINPLRECLLSSILRFSFWRRLFYFFSLLNSNFDGLSFWSELGQLFQVLLLLFGLKSVVKMFLNLPGITPFAVHLEKIRNHLH